MAFVCGAGYDTHIASAIINLDQQVEEDWPVVICDHEGNAHVIPLHAGALIDLPAEWASLAAQLCCSSLSHLPFGC